MDTYLNTERLPVTRHKFLPTARNDTHRERKLHTLNLKSSCPESWIESNKSYDGEKKE